jgi:signal transduction histidine kinase
LRAALLLLVAFSIQAQSAPKQVLVLQSFDRGYLVPDAFTGDLRVELDHRSAAPVNVIQIVVGPTGFVGASDQAVVDYIRSTFAGHRAPDLIVAVSGPASIFARKYRQHLFPDTPLLLTAVDLRYLREVPVAANESSVAVDNDFSLIVDDMLQLLPDTKQVFLVMGSGPLARFWHRELERALHRFQPRVTFIWSDEMSVPTILKRCSTLPPHTTIYFFTLGADAEGSAYADERVLADLHATANAPVFGAHSVMLDHGIVGGRVMDIEHLARNTADATLRILNGAPPASVTVPAQKPGRPVFDWRELQRWKIPESRLPAGSEVRFRGPSPWQEYRWTIVGAIATLIIESLLIVGLIYQRRARQRAELESKRSLALAADVSRRQTMAALSSSIGHELGQPLNAMIINTQALQMILAADTATKETIADILSDIQAQGERATQIINRHRTMLRSRQVEKNRIDLHVVIRESLELVAHEIRSRGIETAIELPSNACIINGDPVLLQQVFVNLLMNAMDAMDETPPARRRLTIRSDETAADVAVSICDTGSGVMSHLLDALFTPFVTTKSQGLGIGLTIARSIVDAHGGKMGVHNNPAEGATFTVRLPRSKATEIAA